MKSAAKWLILPLLMLSLAVASSAGFDLVSKQAKSYASNAAFPVTSPQLRIDRKTNLISIAAVEDVHLTALAGPKAKMMSFQIDELSNPEIRVPKGTRLTLNVINVDDDMPHNLYLTTQAPPYQRAVGTTPIGTGMLKPQKDGHYTGAALILKAAKPGTYYYVCTVTGHARAGMFGKIVVTP
ncbi:MAG TPA: plastocyanin/azurin family copper-binding protein [Terriglobales bacterium]|nr:plastocyanin/azurin family copper-binding protein [Terriglobales bacterium]